MATISTGSLEPALLAYSRSLARSESVVRIGLTDRPPGLAIFLRTDSKRKQGARREGVKRGKMLTRHFYFLDSPMPGVTTRGTLFGRIYMQLVSWVSYTPTFVVLTYSNTSTRSLALDKAQPLPWGSRGYGPDSAIMRAKRQIRLSMLQRARCTRGLPLLVQHQVGERSVRLSRLEIQSPPIVPSYRLLHWLFPGPDAC